MAVTHSMTARNAAANAVVDLLDVGAGPNGTVVFLTSGDVVVATLPMTPKATGAFGNASGGVATANAISPDTNAVGGTVAKIQLRDCNNAPQVYGSVAVSGGDITGTSMVIGSGDSVSLSNLTYAAPV